MKSVKGSIFLIVIVLLMPLYNANAYVEVYNDNVLSIIGEETYSRTFYSNYSKQFYIIFLHDIAGVGTRLDYTTSYDGIHWTEPESLTNEYTSHLSIRGGDFYLEPNGIYLHYIDVRDTDKVYYSRFEILGSGDIYRNNATYNQYILHGVFTGSGASANEDEYSIIADSEGYPILAYETTSKNAIVVRCPFNNGTWNHEEFDNFWFIEAEWIDNGGGNLANFAWGGELAPLKDRDFLYVFWYWRNAGGMIDHTSILYNYTQDDFTNNCGTGSDYNDQEGGDWGTDIIYSISYNEDVVIIVKQIEEGGDYIRLEFMYFNVSIPAWSNRTRVSFLESGDAHSVEFTVWTSMNSDGSTNFVYGITTPTNQSIWCTQMYNNLTRYNYTDTFPNGRIWKLLDTLPYSLEINYFSSTGHSQSPMPIVYEDNNASDTIYFNYLEFLDEPFEAPFGLYNTTLYNSDGSINDGWIFRGETYTLESYFYNASLFHLNFTDGEHEIIFSYDNETQRLSIDSEDQFVLGDYYFNITQYPEGLIKAIWGFIPNTNIVDIEDTTVYYYLYNEELDSEQQASTGIIFNVYNLGGYTYYTFEGDGGRTKGGSPFQIYATNGSDGSRARAEQIFRKLQHISFLLEIDMSNEWDEGNGEFDIDAGIGWIDIGFDYRLNGSWEEGFYIRLFVQDANVGHHDLGIDHNWVEWEVELYNYIPIYENVTNVASQLIYTNHWGYEHENYEPDYYNRTSCQLWVDLWFDRTNASTTIASQVNAYYRGMKEQGSSFWFGYGTFVPMISDYDNAKFLDDLYDEGRNISNCQKYDLIKFFVEVVKVDIEDGNDETWTIRAIEDMHREQAIDRMEGIDEPTFVEAKILDMPQTGFINAIKSALGNIASSISQGIFFSLKSLWAGVGYIFELMGLKEWYNALSIMIGNISTASLNFMDALELALINSALLLEQIFRLFTSVIVKYTSFITDFISNILNWYTAIGEMFSGGGVWNIDIWVSLSLGDWFGLFVTLSPVLWLNRLSKQDNWIATAQGDISFMLLLITGLFNFLSKVILLSISLLSFLIGLLPI